MKKGNLWFRRKKYGWGWTPSTWQGWTVVGFILLVGVAPTIYFSRYKADIRYRCEILKIHSNDKRDKSPEQYDYLDPQIGDLTEPECEDVERAHRADLRLCLIWFATWIFIEIYICYKKGEKPSWQWGGKSGGKK